MLSLYEILKASKTGIAPDLWTRLAAEKMAGDSEKVRELTGELPLTFTANGKPLLDYTIYGNMEQAGAPTPTAPIQPSECGERTKNLFDKDNAVITHLYPLQNGTTFTQGGDDIWSIIMPCKPNTTYTLSKSILSHSNPRHRVSGSEEYPTAGGAQTFIDNNSETISGDTRARQIFTTTADTHWIVCFLYSNNSYEELIEQLQSLQIEEGNDKTEYEPYGYKIPISVNGQTNNIYIGSGPLRKAVDGSAAADTLNYSTQQLIRRVDSSGNALAEPETVTLEVPEIPTVDGQNTIDVLTELKPSEMYIKYQE